MKKKTITNIEYKKIMHLLEDDEICLFEDFFTNDSYEKFTNDNNIIEIVNEKVCYNLIMLLFECLICEFNSL